MSYRLMSDSVSGAAAPGVDLVAAYATGFPGSQVVFKTHPALRHVLIVQRNSITRANVCDVENGAATPAFAASWARYMRTTRQNMHPTVYVSAAAKQSVVDAFTAIHEPLPLFWVAAWGSAAGSYLTPNAVPGPGDVVAHQYADPATSGGNWDLSAVVPYWPGVDPMPYHPPTPLMNHAQWVWVRFTFIPDHYAPALRASVWKELSGHPAKAKALVERYAPANIR